MKFVINAQKRTLQGSGASRRLRLANKVPGIVYGGTEAPALIELEHNELLLALRKEAFHASVLTLKLDGAEQSVLLRDSQMHPYKPLVLHVDFSACRCRACDPPEGAAALHQRRPGAGCQDQRRHCLAGDERNRRDLSAAGSPGLHRSRPEGSGIRSFDSRFAACFPGWRQADRPWQRRSSRRFDSDQESRSG